MQQVSEKQIDDFITAQVGFSWDIVEKIWTADWSEIAEFQLLPGCRMRDDIWFLPYAWCPWGEARRNSSRTIDFGKCLPDSWERSDRRSENAIRRLKRIAALMFTRTLRITKKVMSPKQPRTWVSDVQYLNKLVSAALPVIGLRSHVSTCPDGEAIFACLTDDQMQKLLEKAPITVRKSLIPRMNSLLAHEEFDDWPVPDVASNSTVGYMKRTFQPFSDDFTAILADSAVWVAEVLGPDILLCWQRENELRKERIATSNPVKAREKKCRMLSDFAQETAIGTENFRYYIRVIKQISGKRAKVTMSNWSELSPGISGFLAIRLQDAHATILALCMAPRNGELASLPRDCLRPCIGGGLVRGFTFKLSETEEQRDWPIPSVAVKVVEQQQLLAEMLDPGGAKLFVSFRKDGRRENPRDKHQLKTDSFTDYIYLPNGDCLTSLAQGSVHSHRIRKTTARLAALALVGANQILFDILGHRDPEMTLNYILADPQLQEQMHQIAKEAAIAIAKSAFDDVDANGGPAASAVLQMAGRLKVRSGVDELDEKSLAAAAALLSQDGRVTLVKKGVLCTKTSNQMGECVRSLGTPDIGNCKSSCIHRLELAAAKSDHRNAIEQALAEMNDSGPLMKAWWQAQILTHLLPFADLRVEMLEDDRVKDALVEIDQATLDQLWAKSPMEAARQLEQWHDT